MLQHSRGANAPELCKISSAFPEKGRGECRALDAPAVSRAKWGREHTRSSPWVHRGHPAFPHAMVLTVSFVIFPVIGLCCHRRFACTKLDASVEASEPHDFAVRVQPRSSAVPSTSIASRPASVTIASAPWWNETARLGKCFASNTNAFIFVIGTGQVICPSGTERCGAVALAHTSVIASAANQSSFERKAGLLRRFAPRNDGVRGERSFVALRVAMTKCVIRG